MMNKIKVFFIIILMNASCKKDETVIYQLQDVSANQSSTAKNNAKSTTEFISIAYSDLFGSNISQSDLVKLNTVYTAFGDKKLIEDRIIRNFLIQPGVQIPSAIGLDTTTFISSTYKKFYNREPNAFETYYTSQQLRLNTAITPLIMYYSLMTGDEYRYY